jgi:hypothetical protein
MPKIKCKLITNSTSRFLQQIYTGFFLLYKNGLIDFKQEFNHKKEKKPNNAHQIRVIVDDRIRLHYDMIDGCGINNKDLEASHYYFKRSYSSKYISTFGNRQKRIFPFGLNYELHPSHFDKFALKRNLLLQKGFRKITGIINIFDIQSKLNYKPRINNMQSLPDYHAKPKIIFMVKAFDPYDDADRPENKIDERIKINETRAKCIKMLRDEFGKNFYGGFYHSKFSKQNYSGLLIPDIRNSIKKKYINLLKQYPICIANSGLHGSIGWKFAEYIAFSKAIIAEKMNYEVTGSLEEGQNYLEFQTPEDCLENVLKLFKSEELRHYLMTNNAKYYHAYLRPDALILKTLLIALSGQPKDRFVSGFNSTLKMLNYVNAA